MYCVKTPRHVILPDPHRRIMASLCGDLDDLRRSAKVNLQPLVGGIILGQPGPRVPPPSMSLKPPQPRSVVQVFVLVYVRWCCYLLILDAPRLHSHWSVTEHTCWGRNGVNESKMVPTVSLLSVTNSTCVIYILFSKLIKKMKVLHSELLPSLQPYSSTLREIYPYQVFGWMRMKRAFIVGLNLCSFTRYRS